MRWLVFGEGALGGLIAAKLHQNHQQVAIETRSGNAPRAFIFNQQSTVELPAFDAQFPPEVIIAALKAYDVKDWIHGLQQRRTLDNIPVILSYNGMLANESELLPTTTYHWVTTHGAYRDSVHLIHAGYGESWLGPDDQLNSCPHDIFTILNASLPPFHWYVNIHQKRWHKLAINCLINPLTVLYRCNNGQLLEHPIAEPQRQLANEFVVLARHFGMEWQAEALVSDALAVIRATAQNRSSMLSDIVLGRRTEIDYLNGFVVQQCELLGLNAPTHRWLWEHVRAIETTT
ncbi:MAG TPA: 2-dehydropantoate 2-reductase [Pseudidiomarina sp.]|nr:2-dehydropantoate 2-reductase [Pseudidiomarina sp.]